MRPDTKKSDPAEYMHHAAMQINWLSNPNPASISQPVTPVPQADEKTMPETATERIEPRCFVPYNSGHTVPKMEAAKPIAMPISAIEM
jgi:hypothetical protein